MGDKVNRTREGAKHEPGKNDGLPHNPVAVARYERARAESRRLQTEALELRLAGYSYRQIAAHQSTSVNTALSRVKRAIRRDVPQELIDSTRTIELDRIDTMTKMNLAAMETAYRAGDMETYLKVQDRVNVLHGLRAKIIPIQQPLKLVVDQQVTTQTDQDRELSELIGQQAEQMQAKLDRLQNITDKKFA